jgi:predicted nucleic acid-binding Zn ribbon protein
MHCVFCGQPLEYPVAHCYCSTHCAERQLATLGTLLQSTPLLALSVLEWHELSQSYATDLELLNLVATANGE